MESVEWMMDFPAALMMSMAQKEEMAFADCLESCPRTEGVIMIDEPAVFRRLMEARVRSLLLGLSALESYLGYFAYGVMKRIESESPGITLNDFIESRHLTRHYESQPNRVKRRHETLIEVYGTKPMRQFLASARLTLEEKILYWVTFRTGKPVNVKDGYVKKLNKLMALRDELHHPDLSNPADSGTVASAKEARGIFLHHDLPDGWTAGKSFSAGYVIEPYLEGHFHWELLHCYPAREVQEFIQYLHKLDNSDNHFITAMRPVLLVDERGKALTEPMKKYEIEVRAEGRE